MNAPILKLSAAILSFPGWDRLWDMTLQAFWWGVAIVGAVLMLIPLLLILGLLGALVAVILSEMK